MPTPDPALKLLDPFVGTWSMEGHLVGSSENNIKGRASYRWLPGGFFLEQRVELDFMGMKIESLELIGYDPETKTFPSTVYSNLSPTPLPYRWEVGRRRHSDYLGLIRSPGRNVQGRLQRGRAELQWWLASEPRRRRDGKRPLRHRREPREVNYQPLGPMDRHVARAGFEPATSGL
jgi:hypothetical protein